MAGVGVAVGSLGLAGAAVQPGRPAVEPARAAAMSSIVSYESLVHAVSGAVVSERVGARAAEPLLGGAGWGEGASPRHRPRPLVTGRSGRAGLVGGAEEVAGRFKPLFD